MNKCCDETILYYDTNLKYVTMWQHQSIAWTNDDNNLQHDSSACHSEVIHFHVNAFFTRQWNPLAGLTTLVYCCKAINTELKYSSK